MLTNNIETCKKLSLFFFFLMINAYASLAIAVCDSTNYRYANSSNRIYISGAADCTLSDISQLANVDLLENVDPSRNIWLLKASLILQEGSKLTLHGSQIGGDVDELRLLSNNNPVKIIRINARWGEIDIDTTSIISWDEQAGQPDNIASNQRSYIHVQSFLDGNTPRESRMDIRNSEISFLGYLAAESYGLVWKVVGSQPGIYDLVDVFGNVTDNYIHDNYMGFYSFGAFAMQIERNEIANNLSYGIDPHDDSDELVIADNKSHHNGNHGIICSKRCNDLTITNNESYSNTGHGIMLHRDTNYTLVENNNVHHNTDNGIAVFESHFNTIRNNQVDSNRHGIRLSLGSHDNVIENNSVSNNSQNGLYTFKGTNPPATTDGRPSDNVFRNNSVNNNKRGVEFKESDHNIVEMNQFSGTTDFRFISGIDNIIANNTYTETLSVKTTGDNAQSGSTIIETDSTTAVELNDFGTTELTNAGGRIFQPDANGWVNVVGPSGTSLTLTAGVVGTSTLVTARNFWVAPASGEVQIRNLDWDVDRRTWDSAVGAGSPNVTYRIGDLIANSAYNVFKGSTLLLTVNANQNREISFTDSINSAGATYQVLGAGSSVSLDVEAIDDSYVRGGSFANSNFGSGTQMEFKFASEEYNRQAFFKFDVAGIDSNVSEVKLQLRGKLSRAGSVQSVIAQVADSSWSENSITWNNKPSIGSPIDTITINGTAFADYEIDVTNYVKNALQNGNDSISLAIYNEQSSTAVSKASTKESSEGGPHLFFVY